MFTVLDPKDVEKRLDELIAKHKAEKITVAEIRRRIFEADGKDVMRESNLFNKWWMHCFRRISEESLTELLQAFQDAWNTFPHGSLDGKSPQDMVQEGLRKNPELAKNGIREKDMPTVHVGGMEMEWKEYEAMLRRMEQQQKPFKRWIEERALPEYKLFLKAKYKTKKTIEKHFDVADHFLKRVLHVGFLDFEQIRPAFAVWEFPDWWPSHILYSDLSEEQVWSSLCDFFWFAETILHRSIPGIWEEAEGENFSPDDIVVPPLPKIGRNDPCRCNSGKKYKKCCGG